MALHVNEVEINESVVLSLLKAQCPQWTELPLARAGAGTDNVLYRLGDKLLVRLPRTPDKARSLIKELHWLPHLAPHLSCATPESIYRGEPTTAFPLDWSIYRWIDGETVSPASVRDWATFGADLARIVQQLHGVDLKGATVTGGFDSDRARRLQGGPRCGHAKQVAKDFARCRAIVGADTDLDTLEGMWLAALELPELSDPHVWLHSDLKPANLLAQDGKLCAVIDFGGLSIGFPEAEHVALWDMPATARQAYRDVLKVDENTWRRAQARAISGSLTGILYYWRAWPAFAAECRARLQRILTDSAS